MTQQGTLDLWLITIISLENKQEQKAPEEVFLLNMIEQLINGKSMQKQFNKEVDYVKFKFLDEEMVPVYLVFEDSSLRKEFIEKLRTIMSEIWPKNAK